MRPKLGLAAVSGALFISLWSAAGASAATEFGDNCIGDTPTGAPATFFEISATNNPLPTAAPVAGVITKLKVALAPEAPAFPVNLKVLRQTGPDTVQIVGEVAGTISAGANSLGARIPVQAGDRLGFFSPSGYGAILCEEGSGTAVFGAYEGSGGGPGSSVPFTTFPVSEAQVPLAAVIEPDADNDGFGDETQDACPQSAAVQAPCPPVALSTSKQIRKGSVTIIVTSSTAAPVTVKGVAKLGKGKKAKLNGGTQNMVPGTLSKFRLFFTKALKNKLKELPPKRSVRLNVTVTGTSVSGAVTTKTLKLRLKGQAKP
jgi:hypothetical protein